MHKDDYSSSIQKAVLREFFNHLTEKNLDIPFYKDSIFFAKNSLVGNIFKKTIKQFSCRDNTFHGKLFALVYQLYCNINFLEKLSTCNGIYLLY